MAISLTNDQLSLNLLQNKSGLVGEFSALGSQHSQQPVLPKDVILHPELKEILQDFLNGIVLLQTPHVIKQHLLEDETDRNLTRTIYCISIKKNSLDTRGTEHVMRVFTIELQVRRFWSLNTLCSPEASASLSRSSVILMTKRTVVSV